MNNNVKKFKDNKYIYIKNIINSELSDFITQYALFDEMQNFNPDNYQVPNAHSKYADPAMESLLLKILPVMQKNTGLSLYPTYSFYRIYRSGDILEPHKDRESCEISATICLNYSYDPEQYDWPIVMNEQKISMLPGSMVIYRGIELEHSRQEFNPPNAENDWHVQAFLHYVDINGPYSLYKYDGRESIGVQKSQSRKNKKSYITYLGEK